MNSTTRSVPVEGRQKKDWMVLFLKIRGMIYWADI